MEQTDDIDALMARIAEQETEYELDGLCEQLAMKMGVYALRRAKEMGASIAINISLNGRTLFAASMPGTKPESDDWLRRKANMVRCSNGSSYFWECWCEKGPHPFEWRGLSYEDYAPAGGAFPIRIKGAGAVGVIAITGMASHEDHALAYETVGKAAKGELNVDVSQLGIF